MMNVFKNILATFAVVLVSGLAMAQSVDLSMKWKPDHHYRMKETVDVDVTVPNLQGDADFETKVKIVTEMQGPSANDEKGVVVDMTFGTISMNMVMGGVQMVNYDSTKPDAKNSVLKMEKLLLELNFKTLYGKDGKFIGLKDFDEKELKPEMGFTKDSLASIMQESSQMIPHREVKVGDVWTATLVSSLEGLDDGFSCNYDFKLASVKDLEGKRIARIEFTADMKKVKMKQNGVEMLMSAKNIEGFYLFDVKEGQFTETKTFFDLVLEAQDIEMMMKLNTTTEFHNKSLKK